MPSSGGPVDDVDEAHTTLAPPTTDFCCAWVAPGPRHRLTLSLNDRLPSSQGDRRMPETSTSTVDSREIEHFSALAAEWWNPNGKFRPLHKFNPIRLAYIRDQVAARFARDPRAALPFEGLRILDIGCGGGLLSEPM